MNSPESDMHNGEASASRTLESGHTRDRTVSDTARSWAAKPVAIKQIEDSDVAPGSNAEQSARPQRRGPKTASGKARVSLNAVTHGLSSARLVVPGESPTEWEMSRQGIVDALGPAGPVGLALAERVATILWRLRRVAAYETAAITERQHLTPASAHAPAPGGRPASHRDARGGGRVHGVRP